MHVMWFMYHMINLGRWFLHWCFRHKWWFLLGVLATFLLSFVFAAGWFLPGREWFLLGREWSRGGFYLVASGFLLGREWSRGGFYLVARWFLLGREVSFMWRGGSPWDKERGGLVGPGALLEKP